MHNVIINSRSTTSLALGPQHHFSNYSIVCGFFSKTYCSTVFVFGWHTNDMLTLLSFADHAMLSDPAAALYTNVMITLLSFAGHIRYAVGPRRRFGGSDRGRRGRSGPGARQGLRGAPLFFFFFFFFRAGGRMCRFVFSWRFLTSGDGAAAGLGPGKGYAVLPSLSLFIFVNSVDWKNM